MYYKVVKDNKVIDVLDGITYLQWQPRNKIMLVCRSKDAQAFLSSDGNTIWRDALLNDLPKAAGEYDTVQLIEIDQYEYRQLKVLNMKTPEQIIDEYNLMLLEMGVI